GAGGEWMGGLGYPRYGAEGGDWGYAIPGEFGIIDAAHVAGIHLTSLITLPPDAPAENAAALTEDDRARLDQFARAAAEMAGYQVIQQTRPQTLAYALTDSPVGQLAWIVEKFRSGRTRPTYPRTRLPETAF